MKKESSLVKVDRRHYRAIAQENWGLTDQQMKGMHVHHRIPQSQGGTNDPSNLYVCSPSFHAHVWHGKDSYLPLVEAAMKGGERGSLALMEKIKEAKSKGLMWKPAQERARKMHDKHRGTPEYSDSQAIKAQRAAASKRKHWTEGEYEAAWGEYLSGHSTGYRIAKALGKKKWKTYGNMVKLLSLGYSFEQIVDPDLYVAESIRLKNSSVFHVLARYDD